MIHVHKQVQLLPVDLQTAWNFFSRPENLNDITPPDLHFKVRTTLPEKIYPGLMIVYKLTLFKIIPFEWVTEIMHVQDQIYFVDEQRKGPYSMWHHEHHFKEVDGGVEMTDIVHYKLPMGWLGNLFHDLLVKPQLKKIFDFRRKVLEERKW
ncbi:SRPBCC family protein [Taibaiella soli]|uniref:Cell division inhibitor n=1 Tax=Taibaiella soli TaxID=1649169 RepID=A0A2W2BG72_9BACT|nr:SRPBCC family protein [Taibaiella soli]PZF74907.1 hypothetical protein DN068_01545 [Taibaiella soli]